MQTTIEILEITEDDCCGNLLGFYCKGHVDPVKFYNQLIREYGDDYEPIAIYTPLDVEHTYFYDEEEDDGFTELIRCKASTSGAYPVTVLGFK